MKKKLNLTLSVFITVGTILLFGSFQNTAAAFGSSDTKLQKDDCIKCHGIIVKQLQDGGNKHKSEVACMECHKGTHPPGTEKGALIPQCSRCHNDAGTAHFTLTNCLSCHQNPHQPLNIVLSGEGQKNACNTCHPDQVKEIDSHPTAHTGFACSFCHEVHRDKPDCLSCHEVHSEGQKFENCIKCHQAHQPLTLAYDTSVRNSDCGACHSDIKETLEAGATKHAKFQCVFCHANKHAVVPACVQCHEAPHSENMISKFESCNECHQSAHDILK